MLARMMVAVFLVMCLPSMVLAGQKPDVYVLICSDQRTVKGEAASGLLDTRIAEAKGQKGGKTWRGKQYPVVASPGRAAVLSALLYGRQPLQSGVVVDADWRRKPIRSTSLADHYMKAGYRTAFFGEWLMGRVGGYAPEERGFAESVLVGGRLNAPWGESDWKGSIQKISASLDALAGEEDPLLVVHGSRSLGFSRMIENVVRLVEKRGRESVVLVWRVGLPQGEMVKNRYHLPSSLSVYSFGDEGMNAKVQSVASDRKVDADVHRLLMSLLGSNSVTKETFHVFHKANWSIAESPDRYRHRNSLVVGKGYALVDGLDLYTATENMLPDLEKPLDIEKHQDLHAEMLTAHANWWSQARKALHNPRPFAVGGKDGVAVPLTALDWRASKTVHADGSSPFLQPIVFQHDVTELLKKMQKEDYRLGYPAHSGGWSVNILRPGRYQITAGLLPQGLKNKEQLALGKLRGGRAFIRLGRNQVELPITKGASAVMVQTDADAGVTDLECWFTGQLALERELGAFFVEIQRVGDKKFEFEAKEAE